jgi:hypothetical protein
MPKRPSRQAPSVPPKQSLSGLAALALLQLPPQLSAPATMVARRNLEQVALFSKPLAAIPEMVFKPVQAATPSWLRLERELEPEVRPQEQTATHNPPHRPIHGPEAAVLGLALQSMERLVETLPLPPQVVALADQSRQPQPQPLAEMAARSPPETSMPLLAEQPPVPMEVLHLPLTLTDSAAAAARVVAAVTQSTAAVEVLVSNPVEAEAEAAHQT